ncbi:bifunctional glutamate N-acetyltransferase/amino-acid acetyltransferase ArgJ [Myceligenerans pegani]|uniref:Arginine biosynthesis bifunctional protein ArgJ n=1 Tax=Myceligenerans pegani TaxID=2776917 RepID=A0ABR9MZQ0_9MICO|nr:bifunctional glutamate N-acetyltransferase/amino-acid acetyltransferase ArgJ [Myceligenerans sp. TRM 65318]MBE1876506.1 bifunctional glutamate N-acetyltransferase/amino-acid acetyltransferase ArgJ [Myceligenerans sp. TRM 65318]MBE3018777.1 bifunctional glutamate N-acetyltransferase/amino-acid acetyltransferase ArgJ [Myceligenerans sp. TRM 65318]
MSVTAAQGFRAAGITAGLKASGRPDLALVVNDGPRYAAAAVFTSNRVVGAPVLWSRQAVKDGAARAVVLNSGSANVCTGPGGFQDAHATAEAVAESLGIGAIDVLVASTGVIGVRLAREKLLAGIPVVTSALADDAAAGQAAAAAIMTTDTVSKTAVRTIDTPRGAVTVGGMAKGAGMLAPALATMLCVITTDAVVPHEEADAALRAATRVTFDRVDSDGCQSTSDTVVLMASGASGIAPDSREFAAAVREVCADLARQLLADAEGAAHDIAITVRNATSEDAALAVARAVSRSNLVKTAIFGNDPNWGRILAQVGTVPVEVAPFDPEALDIYVNSVKVCQAGGAHESPDKVDLASSREATIDIDLHAGEAEATLWTNDLTHAYVEENSAYTS